MAQTGERVVILVCDGHEPGSSPSPREYLRHLAPRASSQTVKDLCTGSRALFGALREHADDFVVLLPCRSHRGHPRAVRLRDRVNESSAVAARIVIIDPTDLHSDDVGQWAKLAAATASSAALVGSSVAAILNGFTPTAGGVSRRAVLTGRLREQRPTPRLVGERCCVSAGCRLCVEACPTSALLMDDGVPRVNASACDGCGACVLACPRDLLETPTMPRQIWESFVQHVLVGAREVGLPVGIWWSCSDVADPPRPQPSTAWLRLRVPCVRALTPAWILQPLSRGAAQVTVTSCGAAGDAWGPGDPTPRLLAALAAGLPSTPSSSALVLREPAGTEDALVNFPPSARTFIASERAPLGVVTCADQSCTACGLCAEHCPTGALKATEWPSSWTLSFAHARCAACGSCVIRCPEHALTLRRGVQPADLHVARELVSTSLRRCVVCGARLAAPGLMARLADVGVRVPEDGRCGDCRTAATRSA